VSAPDIERLFIAPDELAEASGVVARDPLVAPGGQRAKSAGVAAATGLVGGLVAALALVPDLRWPAGLAVGALIVCLVAALAEVGEVVVAAVIAALAALAWFGLRVADAGTPALAGAAGIAIALAGATFYGTRLLRERKRRSAGYDVLTRLEEAIARFNALVHAVDVKERLARARGAPEGGTREGVLAALATTRENLLRAVRVQRVLRENRHVVAGAQHLRVDDLVPLEALRIEAEADAYSELVGETVELAAEVQEAYDSLRRESPGN
jgi:hypothetical protein